MFRNRWTRRYLLWFLAGSCFFLLVPSLFAGDYLNSAHGSGSGGVFRPVIGNNPPAGFGYSRGNCAHCHEQHGSIGGSEPLPTTGRPSTFTLFADNFNTAQKTNPYSEADNFCFFCHNNPASAQSVLNYDYSQVFGCGPQGTNTIKAAVNQLSYHNLYDVWNFSKSQFPWFTSYSNPCNSCHNPHLARKNWANPRDPSFSALSKPDDHFALWGTSETMDSSYNTKYQPPYCSSSQTNYEPASSADAAAGRTATPDYVAFCTTCHSTTNTLFSTTLNRNLKTIDWSASGDKHGLRAMNGSVSTIAPYDTPAGGTDFVLSCLDCHDPHGSANTMLLRRRVNGSDLSGLITSSDTTDWGLICMKCHKDDNEAGIGDANSWEYVHHKVSDAPYLQFQCRRCHSGGGMGGSSIPCQECHGHNSVAIKADRDGNYRIGF